MWKQLFRPIMPVSILRTCALRRLLCAGCSNILSLPTASTLELQEWAAQTGRSESWQDLWHGLEGRWTRTYAKGTQKGSQKGKPSQSNATRPRRKPAPGKAAKADSGASPIISEEVVKEKDVVKLILTAVENVKPFFSVRSGFSGAGGGKVLTIPAVMHPRRQRSVAVRWIVDAARNRSKKTGFPLHRSLALELLLASQKRGSAREKRDQTHTLALQNKANIQDRWW